MSGARRERETPAEGRPLVERLSCPYCGLPLPSGAPDQGACNGHSDLPALEPWLLEADAIALALYQLTFETMAETALERAPPSRALQPRS